MRLLIVSGHNRTSQSATALATAWHAARTGSRVLLASTGPLHMLGALMHERLGARPREVGPNLAALEIATADEVEQRWEQLRPTFRNGLVSRLSDIGSDELPNFPGMDAVGALLVADRADRTGQFDLLVLDGPSPDLLLNALTLPDSLRWLVRLLFGIDRDPGSSRNSQSAAILPMALLPANSTAPLQDLRVVLEAQRARLDGSTGARIRLVASHDELALPAIRTTLTGLGLYGLNVDTIFARDGAALSDEVRQAFTATAARPRPDVISAALDTTAAGHDEWAKRGAALYQDRELFTDSGINRNATSNGREILVQIPFLDPEALDIAAATEEVIVQLGPFRRHVLLPGIAAGGRLRAKVEGETLRLWVE